MVLTIRMGEAGRLVLSEFLEENGVESIPFDGEDFAKTDLAVA